MTHYYHLRGLLRQKGRSLRLALNAKTRDEHLIRKLSNAVTDLVNQLRVVISFGEIRKILAGIGLTIALQGVHGHLQAQSFSPPVVNPFGLQDIYNGAWVDVADIDDDGDLDVFVGRYDYDGRTMLFFENVGDATEPSFATPDTNAFGITTELEFIMPEFADIDNDGDLDLFALYQYGIAFQENIGDAQNPNFAAPVDAPFGFQLPTDYIYSPNLADLDNDGDLDLLVGAYYDYETQDYYFAGIYYFENTGTATEPQFAEGILNPFGATFVYYQSLPTLADLDDDGDLDLLMGDIYQYYSGSISSKLVYFENIGDKENPEFDERQENPFGLSGGDYLSYPCFADMDDDGDLDLFVGQANASDYDYGSLLYFENEGASSVEPVVDSELLVVSPNPASNFLEIQTTIDIESLEVIDALGRTRSAPIGELTIDVSDFPSGLTIVRATTGEGEVYIRKVLVVH